MEKVDVKKENGSLVANPWILAACMAAIYLLYRALIMLVTTQSGREFSGIENYDTLYLYSYAREILESRALFFHNVWFSLDSEPHLFSPLALLLSILMATFANSIVLSDLFFGLASIFFGCYFLAATFPVLKLRQWLAVFGAGSFVFIVSSFVHTDGTEPSSMFWGLTFVTNLNSTPEIFFHGIFFCVLFLLYQNKLVWGGILAGALVWVHPFNGLMAIAMLTAFLLLNWRTKGTSELRPTVIALTICGLLAATYSFYIDVYLPEVSLDARFMRQAYDNFDPYIAPWEYTLTLLPPLLLTFIFVRRGFNFKMFVVQNTLLSACLIASAIALLIGLSPVFGLDLVQPAHWTRVYPHLFLWILFFSVSDVPTSMTRWIAKVIILLCLADSAIYLKQYFEIQRNSRIASLPKRVVQVLHRLNSEPQGLLLEIKPCQLRYPSRPLDFEYLTTAFTHHNVLAGHLYFSPLHDEVVRDGKSCSPGIGRLISKYRVKYLVGECTATKEVGVPLGFTYAWNQGPICLLKKEN